jgi:hypothetical protein
LNDTAIVTTLEPACDHTFADLAELLAGEQLLLNHWLQPYHRADRGLKWYATLD